MTEKREERMKILELVSSGKISAEDGVRLLEAVENSTPESKARPETSPNEESPRPHPARWMHIRVTDPKTNAVKVNVTLPLPLIQAGMKVGNRFPFGFPGRHGRHNRRGIPDWIEMPDMPDFESDNFDELLRKGEAGSIVDVTDVEDGERVEIFLD